MLRACLAALLLALACAVPAGAATERHCGDLGSLSTPDAPQNVRALFVGCATARHLARRHWNRVGDGERCDLAAPACTLDGWRCRRTFFGNSGTRVRCTSGEARVRFIYGV